MSVAAKSASNPEKGARYLELLDQALCNASWFEVPELSRKTEKHAPNRKCLTLAARSEAQIASASHRPTSASSDPTASLHGLSELIPRLEEAIVVGNSIEEDAFIASVCLAEIHWLREDQETALKLLPDFIPESNTHSLPSAVGWMEVCAAKTTYIKATSLESQGKDTEARKLYQEAITKTPGARSPELRKWTERLLARACMHFNAHDDTLSIRTLTDALRAFTAWSDFWQRSSSAVMGSGESPARIDTPRRQIWRAYYDLLSKILQRGFTYYISSNGRIHIGTLDTVPAEFRTPAKQRQRTDLKRVESTYESLLIQETKFPKASQANLEVDQWIEQSMKNWRIICGFGWTDTELGQGGKAGVSRNMLDILYRAATKTFHSTAVLRELFNVHASLGEFDLAMHAFDSYVEIVGKGKARAEKTGHHDAGIDDDDTAVLTGAEAVRVLCRYGDHAQAEKALGVGKNLQKWLGLRRPQSSESQQSTAATNEQGDNTSVQQTQPQLKATTLATAYRAIGISQAHWARLTYDTDSRPALQAEALQHLKRAEAQEPASIETGYALASLLAESRDVSAAVFTIKRVIAANPKGGKDIEENDYARERKLIPLWHLLALCLSAKDQHDAAIKMCDVAFDQFGDPALLFGKSTLQAQDPEKQSVPIGLVDQMEGSEKEALVQIKMTQLALMELLDGPGIAVDMTDELLSLYARLFGTPEQVKAPKPPPTANSVAPSRAGGTLRSIAGSIRPRTNRPSTDRPRQRVVSHGSALEPVNAGGPPNSVAAAGQDSGPPIAITVTNEEGFAADRGRGRQENRHLPFRFRSSASKTRSRSRSMGGKSKPVPNENDQPPLPPPKDHPALIQSSAAVSEPPVASVISNDRDEKNPQEQDLKSIAHNATHDDWPPPAGHEEQPPRQDVRLPAPHPASNSTPAPSLSLVQQKRHKVSILVNIWLFIAELYIRAESFDDASGAVEEAHKLVESFELEVAVEDSSAKSLQYKGWGGGKSTDELWADVWSIKGDLASARSSPFEASSYWEASLSYFPDHPSSIISLSSLLLDIYTQILPAEPPQPNVPTAGGTAINTVAFRSQAAPISELPNTTAPSTDAPGPCSSSRKDPPPAELNRLAARERAYMLLSSLTRLGTGWDDSEAWLALARAHELSGQVGKAKEALWWVVELEESRGVRGWRDGGLAL
ncbi:hypothetical protein Q7P37_005325 [Cladosporium fusiforme]